MSTTTHNHAPQPDRQYTAPGFDNPDTQPIPASPDAGTPTPDADPAAQGIFGDIDSQLFTLRDLDQNAVDVIRNGLGRVEAADTPLMTSLKDIHDGMLWSAFSNAPRYAMPVIELGQAELALAVQQQFDISEGDDPIGKARAVHEFLNDSAASAADDEKTTLTKMAGAVGKYIERADSDDEQTKIADLRQNAVAGYYADAKSTYPHPTPEVFAARKKVDELKKVIDEDVEALAYVNALADHVDAPTPVDLIDLEPLEAQLAEAREQLAVIHAKRQKTVYGFDFNSQNASLGKKNLETIRAQKNYNKHLQMLLAAEMAAKVAADGMFADEDAANVFLAERVAAEGDTLEAVTVEQYTNNNTRLGKVINWMAGRKPNGEKDPSKLKLGLRLAVIGAGAGVTLAVGALGGAVAAGVVGGAIATAKSFAILEGRGRHNRTQKTKGLLRKEDVIEKLKGYERGAVYREDTQSYEDNMTDAEYFNEKMQFVGSLLEGAAERETRRQKLHVAKRLGAAAVIGVGAKFGAYHLTEMMFGSDEAVSAVQDAAPKETPKEIPTGSWWGEAQPTGGSPDVPAPDESGSIPPLLDEVPTGGSPDALPSLGDTPTMELPDGTTIDVPAEYANTNPYTGPGRVYVQPGGGYFDVFKQMGIPESQWGTVLNRVGPALIEHGDAMRLPSGLGSYGVGRPGYVSKFTIDAIKYAATL